MELVTQLTTGTKVHYHPIIGEAHDGKVYSVRAVGTIPSSKNPVVWLNEKVGCVCIESLSLARDPAI